MDAAASAVVKQTEREKGATDGNASVIEGAPILPAAPALPQLDASRGL